VDADSDDDTLSDGAEKLFDSDPTRDSSPGIYVIYEDSFKTSEYYPWQPYGHKLIARGDAFNPTRPDVYDEKGRHGVDLDAVVVRRGTTFSVGGPLDAVLQISKSSSRLSSLSKVRDPYTGLWHVSVPKTGTVGKYTLSLGAERLDVFVIFQLPTPSGDLTQKGVETFLYDDNPNNTTENESILLGDTRYPPDTGSPYDGLLSSQNFVAEGESYGFSNQQYNRFILEDFVVPAINGKTSQTAAADALTNKVDAVTIFRNPRVLYDSWRVLNPGSNPRQQCSNIAGLLTAFSRAAGIPARPVMVDWRTNSFDHATEIWSSNDWRVYRGYRRLEMNEYPDNTPTGCAAGQWPACGSYKYYSRSDWGKSIYKPWHSGGGGNGNVMVLGGENWTSTGSRAYRWASWDIDAIKLNTSKFATQFAEYWRSYGWTGEPRNTGSPGWPPPPPGAAASETPSGPVEGTAFDFQSAQVQLGDVVAEYGIDSNGNGQYDHLVLEVQVAAAQPGDYWLLGQLSASRPVAGLAASGGVIAEAWAQARLVQGSQIVQLVFDGQEIALKRVDGPYLLNGLWITDVQNPDPVEFMNNSLAYRGNLYTTAAYAAASFETYGALLSGSYSHQDVDGDADGRSDALVVTTGINVYRPATYTVQASLYDSRDEFIAQASWTGTGPQVTLRFDGVAGTVGPYTLRDLDLLNSEGQSIDYVAEAYRIDPIPSLTYPAVASLDVLPADADQLMALGEAIVPTQVFHESLVNGNLVVSAEVQVSTAGSYKLAAWLVDANGSLVTWAMGQPTTLGVGRQTLSVVFQGDTIRARGLAGPYTVVALQVLAGDSQYEVLDKVDIALTTQAYRLDQFTANGITILEDFVETGDQLWTAAVPWTIDQGHSYSTTHAWYGSNANASLTLASPMNLAIAGVASMRLQTAYKFSGGERGYVEASADGTNWSTLMEFSGEATWSTRFVSLRTFVGQPAVYLRFRLASAGGAADDGWYIDDVLVAWTIDTDRDGLPDGDEPIYGTDPNNPDSDGDGLADGAEVDVYGTDPNNPDSDGDGMPDGWEVAHGLNPLNGGDAAADPDGDGLTNGDEYEAHTDPNNPDTDQDGIVDGQDPTPAPRMLLPIILK
jgi:hypothetical protein